MWKSNYFIESLKINGKTLAQIKNEYKIKTNLHTRK